MSTYCKAGGGSPNARSLGVENGGLVEIPSSHQTTNFASVSKRVEDTVICEGTWNQYML